MIPLKGYGPREIVTIHVGIHHKFHQAECQGWFSAEIHRKSPKIPENHSSVRVDNNPAVNSEFAHKPVKLFSSKACLSRTGFCWTFWMLLEDIVVEKMGPRLWPWGFGRWFLGGPFWKDSPNNPCFEFAKDLAEKGKSHKKILVQRDFQTSWAFWGSPLHSIIIIGMLPNPCENVRHRGWEGNPGNPGLLHRHIALHRKTTLQEPVLSSKNYRGNIFREGKHIHFSIDSDFMTPMTPFFFKLNQTFGWRGHCHDSRWT